MTAARNPLPCFKAYDVRGRVPEQLNVGLAYDIGRAYAAEVRPKGPVAVGRDVRPTSPALAEALVRGLNDAGCDTCDIGLCGTEMIYFAASRPGMGGGIMVTASHNPMEYNGMKFVRAGSVPISGDTGLDRIERRARTRNVAQGPRRGSAFRGDVMESYVEQLMTFVAESALMPLRIVANAGNGCAGPALDAIAGRLPFQFVRLHHEPDPRFPHGIPNPMLEENRTATAQAVRDHGADLGLAWDGDFDRCFFFDERGAFVEGYYIVGLLAERMLKRRPGAAVVHDPRLVWNTVELVEAGGGRAVQSKTGHAFIKERMRQEAAVYGGEMSAHHYFQDFAYCDSGMIPWLLVAEALSQSGQPLSALVGERMRRFPCSGEINRKFAAQEQSRSAIARVRERYEAVAAQVEEVDGVSMSFDDGWRFNLRLSQTEPILRLNVEARGDHALLEARTRELLELIDHP